MKDVNSDMQGGQPVKKHHHHILQYRTIVIVGASLYFLTILTVAVAHIDLGRLNFPIALLIAAVKASLVAFFFMNLWFDRGENGIIFGTSFVFLAIFIVLTSTDVFFRGNVYVKPGTPLMITSTKSTLKNPWISTPELVARGHKLFEQNCATCHGPTGHGDGVAASGLNPKPRNFTSAAGWVNGRKPSQVFSTLMHGVPGSAMASWSTLPVDDRWALVHFVLSLGPTPPKDTPQDLAKIGYGPGGKMMAQKAAPTIPIDVAMERMEVPAQQFYPTGTHPKFEQMPKGQAALAVSGAGIYVTNCASCHGVHGEGGVRVLNAGVFPRAFVETRAFNSQLDSIRSPDAFKHIVTQGLPGGSLMPGFGQLTESELTSLLQYVRSIAADNVAAR